MQMKKLFVVLAVLCSLTSDLCFAAVPGTDAINVITAANWTNALAGSPLKLVLFEAFNANAPTGTVTFTRISDTRTNSIGTITLASSAGRLNVATDVYVFPGDQVRAVLSGGATNIDLEFTGERAEIRRDALLVANTNFWINTYGFQAQKLLTVEAFNGSPTNGTVTLSRIRGLRTNTLGSITLAAGAGSVTITTNNVWLWPGDKVRMILSGGCTNCDTEITKALGL